ncbi:hypothetical protein ACFL6S_34860 [Candidatus Poribacteria bacterium]
MRRYGIVVFLLLFALVSTSQSQSDREVGLVLLFGAKVEAQSDLNNGIISQGLRQEFDDKRISLSYDPAVSVEKIDARWLITDGGRTYIVVKKDGKLNIYYRRDIHEVYKRPDNRSWGKIFSHLFDKEPFNKSYAIVIRWCPRFDRSSR